MANQIGGEKPRVATPFLIGSLAFSMLVANSQIAEAQDNTLKSDVTIYLDGPLLNRGGTVFVVPREVPLNEWKPHSDQPNPARDDSRLDIRKPITPQDTRLSALAFSQVSIVRFDYPAGGSYDFRFLPSLESGVLPEKQGSVLVEAGNTYDYHPKTREEMFVPVFQVLTILGPDANEGKSRSLVSDVKLGYLQERYDCKQFENVLSCSVPDYPK